MGETNLEQLELLYVETLLAILAVLVEPVLRIIGYLNQLLAQVVLHVRLQIILVVHPGPDGEHELFERVLRIDPVPLLAVLRLQLRLAFTQLLHLVRSQTARLALHNQIDRLDDLLGRWSLVSGRIVLRVHLGRVCGRRRRSAIRTFRLRVHRFAIGLQVAFDHAGRFGSGLRRLLLHQSGRHDLESAVQVEAYFDFDFLRFALSSWLDRLDVELADRLVRFVDPLHVLVRVAGRQNERTFAVERQQLREGHGVELGEHFQLTEIQQNQSLL